jgi:hypothetical protein
MTSAAAVLLPLLLLLAGSAVYVRTTAYFLVKVPVRLYHVVVRKEIGGRSKRATKQTLGSTRITAIYVRKIRHGNIRKIRYAAQMTCMQAGNIWRQEFTQ